MSSDAPTPYASADVPPFRIREATEEDDYRIEDVRIASWRAAYRHLLPEDYFDGWDYDAVIESRRANRRPDLGRLVVEEPSGRVTAFSFYGPSRDEDGAGRGEVYAFYVAPRLWGHGQAAPLMYRTLVGLAQFADVRLWVLRDTPRARRFYEKCGFEADGSEQLHSFPKRLVLPEIRYRLHK